MSTISTHVLDTANGQPAAGVTITLERVSGDQFDQIGGGITNSDGRVTDLLSPNTLTTGTYRMSFLNLESYNDGFYPEVRVMFKVTETDSHYHVPLLLSPYGYSTYRGS